MRLFVSRRVIHRRQARAMVGFFLVMGALAVAAAALAVARRVWPN
jgi:hypothetical protein